MTFAYFAQQNPNKEITVPTRWITKSFFLTPHFSWHFIKYLINQIIGSKNFSSLLKTIFSFFLVFFRHLLPPVKTFSKNLYVMPKHFPIYHKMAPPKCFGKHLVKFFRF